MAKYVLSPEAARSIAKIDENNFDKLSEVIETKRYVRQIAALTCVITAGKNDVCSMNNVTFWSVESFCARGCVDAFTP